MINTCFHIPNAWFIVQACRSTSSASLFISLLAPIFCCVYFFFSLTPTAKYYLYCVERKSRQIYAPAHAVTEATEWQKLIFLISNLDVDSEGERWWAKVVVGLDSLSHGPPNLFCFLLGNNSFCFQFFSPRLSLASFFRSQICLSAVRLFSSWCIKSRDSFIFSTIRQLNFICSV